MKKTLNMVCPHCKLKAELKIQEEAEMILMRCVSCSAPYLYFHGETFEVNENEMDHLKSAEMKEVEGLLKVEEDSAEVQDNESEIIEMASLPSLPEIDEPEIVQYNHRELNRAINRQDLIDLRIDLETSMDVLDFLQKV